MLSVFGRHCLAALYIKMEAVRYRLTKDYHDILNEIKEDNVVNTWILLNPQLIFSIICIYLLIVLKVGPAFMKNRQPYNLKYCMIVYNFIQVLYNLYMFSKMFMTPNAVVYLFRNSCRFVDAEARQWDNPLYSSLCVSGWLYLLSKIIDLLDTLFFVLRKKQSHVSFLHVYHHANLVFTGWAYLKYIRGEPGIVIGFINAGVHTVMYAYYLLSALGPEIQRYLWWKHYITRIQLIQFMFVICYLGSLIVFDCQMPKIYNYYMFFNGALFLYLFLNFYKTTYRTPSKIIKPKIS